MGGSRKPCGVSSSRAREPARSAQLVAPRRWPVSHAPGPLRSVGVRAEPELLPPSRGSADGRDHAHRVDRTVSNGSDRGRNRFGSGSVGAVPSPARIDLRSRSGGMVSQRPSIDVSILAHSPNSAGFAPIHVGEVSRMAACRGAVAASTSGLTGGGGRDSPNWRPPRGARAADAPGSSWAFGAH